MSGSPTPGPWEAAGPSVWAQNPRVAQRDISWPVGVCVDKGAKGHHGPTRAESAANAQLIAACPTMYAYIEKRAADGDAEARSIVEGIHAS
jgi:hypothetical protein